GDPLALRVLSEAADALGTTLAWCVMMLNPALIVIGGGLGIAAYDLLAEPARAAMTARLIPDLAPLIQIAPSHIESSALGAAALVWHEVDAG
ncbi:MAG: ROK family protein, partial [Anaerolineae bacterium]|nr:ROK family protein [Anaerolineae bacterium]